MRKMVQLMLALLVCGVCLLIVAPQPDRTMARRGLR